MVGKITDSGTDEGLNNVQVRTGTPADTSTISSQSADPVFGDGFYTLYAMSGAQSLTASLPPYPGIDVNVTVPNRDAVRMDLELSAGALVFTPPNGPEAELAFGNTASPPFSVRNTGDAPVQFNLLAEALKEDFEDMFPPRGWSVVNHGGDCVWKSNKDWFVINVAGGEGLAAAVNSDECFVAGGKTTDTSLVSPRIDLSRSTAARLRFVYGFTYFATSRLDVDVSIDDGTSWTTVLSRNSGVAENVPADIDLAAFSGAADFRMRFHYVAPVHDRYMVIDQIQLLGSTNVIPWLTVAPSDGVLDAGASMNLATVMDSVRAGQPGTYTRPLFVWANTPRTIAPLAVTMIATVPASFGTLQGIVRSLGHCDANPTPLEYATILIQGATRQYQTTTDSNGQYHWTLDAAEAPLQVTANAADHVSISASGVMLAAGTTSTQDLDLRLMQACFATAPTGITDALDPNSTHSQILDVLNLGAAPLSEWHFEVGTDPTVPTELILSQSASTSMQWVPAPKPCEIDLTVPYSPENSYLRKFDLAGRGFTPGSSVDIDSFTFTVGYSDPGTDPDLSVDVNVYTLPHDAEFTYANMSLAGATRVHLIGSIQIEPRTVAFSPPIQVPNDAIVVVELHAPSGKRANSTFRIGTNTAGEIRTGVLLLGALLREPDALQRASGFVL